MTANEVAAYFKSYLEAISGWEGKVYTHPLDIKEKKDLQQYAWVWDPEQERYITNCWFISRTSARPVRGGAQRGIPLMKGAFLETYTLDGWYDFYGWNGESEEAFQSLVDSVMAKLLAQITIGQAADEVTLLEVNVPRIELREFGPVLCHHCEIALTVEHVKSVSYT